MLGKIAQFFDWEGFAVGKEFEVVACSDWFDYNDKTKRLGVKITLCIVKDDTNYGEEGFSNAYERLTFKVKTNLPVGDYAKVLKPRMSVFPIVTECKIYGNFNNQLSIVAQSFYDKGGKNKLI